MSPRGTFLLLPLLGAAALRCPPPPPEGRCGPDANLHTVAFESNLRSSTVYLLASAEVHGFTNVAILGTGRSAKWGMGMQHKLSSYRNYIQANVCECDIVLLIDAGDVLVLGSPAKVEARFRTLEAKWNRSVFFGGEVVCTEWDVPVCKQLDKLTAGHGDWRFLNSGLIAGRGRTLQRIFAEPITEAIAHDQEWWRSYFLKHATDLGLGIDYDTDLFVVVAGVEGVLSGEWISLLGQPTGSIALQKVDGAEKLVNRRTQTFPLIAHFPGPGKWPSWLPSDRSSTVSRRGASLADNIWHFLRGDLETCTIQELFLRLYPTQAEVLKITQSEQFRVLGALPSHRPTCVGLDNKSPWDAYNILLGSLSRLAAVTLLLFVLLIMALVALLISCKAAWFAKRRMLPSWLVAWLRRCEERIEDVEMKAL